MKTIVLLPIFTALFLILETHAQDPFYPNRKNLTLTYTEKDAKGKVTGYTITTVKEITVTDEHNFSVTSTSEVLDAKKKPLTAEAMTMTIEVVNGVVKFDPKSFAGKLTEGMQVSGENFLLPARIHVGDIIKDHTIAISIGPMKTITTHTDNKVSGKETLNIDGHILECYLIESTIISKVMGMKQESTDKVWYARGIGQVKMEMYNKKGKLQMSQELTNIQGL